jgi:hypothetical protein
MMTFGNESDEPTSHAQLTNSSGATRLGENPNRGWKPGNVANLRAADLLLTDEELAPTRRGERTLDRRLPIRCAGYRTISPVALARSMIRTATTVAATLIVTTKT